MRRSRPMPLYGSAAVRRLEDAARRTEPGVDLMRRAGEAAAALAWRMAEGGAVLVLAGPGNNGGDAFVVARELRRRGGRVTCLFAGPAGPHPADAAAARQAWTEAGGDVVDAFPPAMGYALIVDGLFGIGLTRDLTGRALELVQRVNASALPVLALDVPSGLDADSGAIRGAAVRAHTTITFLGAKPGLFTAAGPDHAGRIVVDGLGFDAAALIPPDGETLERGSVAPLLGVRPRDSHKGAFGSVAVIGGAPGMLGAAVLAGRAAFTSGAGKVYVAALEAAQPPLDPVVPELMWRSVDETFGIEGLGALAIGPGLGRQSAAHELVGRALALPVALVVDADALNLMAGDATLANAAAARRNTTVLTPHPAEAARLLGSTTAAVQADRIAAARTLAQRFGSHVVLKGAGSVCAAPDGSWRINTSGNPGMSSAGMGDVLTGMIAGFLAQRLDGAAALALAVHLHGAAADSLVDRGIGPIGLSASETALEARALLNRWVYRPDAP